MDNLTDYQRKRYKLLTNIQKMVASDFSDKDIDKIHKDSIIAISYSKEFK